MQTKSNEHLPWSHRLETGPAECAERLNNRIDKHMNNNKNNDTNNNNNYDTNTNHKGGKCS